MDWRVIWIETPPILAGTDGAIISRLAGGTLMVLRAGQHPMREVTLALRRCDFSPGRSFASGT